MSYAGVAAIASRRQQRLNLLALPAFGAPLERMSKLRLLQASSAADKAWMTEVVAVFGRDAGLARFQDRANGEAGSRLRELYNGYVAARDAYLSA